MKVMELFAGVGGFRIGMEEEEGVKVHWGNQWEPSRKRQDAHNCYVRHFDLINNQDIATVTRGELEGIGANVLVGGFPCQDYSVMRSRSGSLGIEGKKGVLFWEIVRCLEIVQPQYVLLENVDRLLKSPSSQRGRDFSIMLAAFRDLGYYVEWRVINAAEYGGVQRRKRVFIFACKEERVWEGMLGKDEEVLSTSGFFAKPFPIESIEMKQKVVLPASLLDVSDTFTASYEQAGIMRNGEVSTGKPLVLAESPRMLRDILQSEEEVDRKYYLTDEQQEKLRYMKGAKRIERVAKNGHAYVYSEGGMAYPDLLDRPARTMLTSEGSVNRSSHVIEDQRGIRFLTPVECERLNGFPDGWTEGMTNRMRYFCMGNALVVTLIERMTKRLSEVEQHVLLVECNRPN